ncbi:recombinase family protein [Shinella sedimenti]|uniref:Recombinase family protein n=1 Tax=Shinella sedimenti TaxID=2919913 RepID=A0ABT0CKF3_9HYPH|nr:recombinase family protein [Shinella sedimenti]MCJ8149103.1 recombinase family protein [Shinella sedimenti]
MPEKTVHAIRPKAYSYVRFSTPEQMRGDSLRRQTEAAERYAALHGLDLDRELTFRDLGVSAYRGANADTGHLGEFLAAVRHGDIKPGSFLLVESLDRLSRQKPRRAVRVLEQLCEEGITVVTLDDQRAYTEEVLDEDPTALLVAILVAARAHEESATKARRVREAWGAKRKTAAAKPLTRLCPGWVRLRDDRSGFDLIPERAAIVRRIFDMALSGRGQYSIAETLNREGIPVFGRGRHWHRSYVKKMLANPSTIGTYTPHTMERVNGKRVRTPTEPVPDYFPAAVDRETFERVNGLTKGRAIGAQPERSRAPANMLATLAKCPLCGGTMTRVSKGRGKRAGKPYLVCAAAKTGAGCEYHQVRAEYVHVAILGKAEELVANMPSPSEDLEAQWSHLSGEIAGLEEATERVVEAISVAGHSKALLDRLRETEGLLEVARRRQEALAGEIASTLTNRVQNVANNDFLGAVESGDVGRINAALRQLFSRIVVNYHTGCLEAHWKHVPDAVSEVFFILPMGGDD